MNEAPLTLASALPLPRAGIATSRARAYAADDIGGDGDHGDDLDVDATVQPADDWELPEPETAPSAARSALTPTLDDPALAALIERIVHQDERALQTLYDATSARVHGLALRITQRRALSEEVVEDTYWQVWRQAARFDPARGRPLTWLLAMARSRAIDALRRDQRFQHDELPQDDALEAADAGHETAAVPPQDLMDATRGANHLQAALTALDARARQLVSLAFFRGLTHEEIATQEGLPLGTVKSIIRRALIELRRTLEAHHECC